MGGLEISTGSCDVRMPIIGTCHLYLRLDRFNPHTKFEVSMITCYEDMRVATQNVEIVVVWAFGVVRGTQGHQQCHRSIPFSNYNELFVQSCQF